MSSLPRSKILLVVGFCLILFLGGAGWLMKLQRMGPAQLHALPWYPTYVQYRALQFRPFSVFMDLLPVVYGVVWVFKPRKMPVSETLRMGVLALVVCIILAYALFVLFEL